MRYAVNKWNIRITINGITAVPFYEGFKTKKEAQFQADRWIALGHKAEVIKY
jgi:hypothetical protein